MKQRGFLFPALVNPWVLLGAAIAAIGLYAWGRYDGHEIEAAKYERLNTARAIAQAQDTARWAKWAREAQTRHASELNQASTAYQGDLRRIEDEKASVLADLAAHKRRLSIPARCPGAIAGGVPATDAGTGGRDAEPRAELSDAAAQFLVAEATRADKIVAQLTAAQKVIRACEALGGKP